MITDSYDIETEPMINLFDFYGRRGDFADMRLGILPNEDGLFWQAVDLYKVLYGKSNDEAIKTISSKVNEIVQQYS